MSTQINRKKLESFRFQTMLESTRKRMNNLEVLDFLKECGADEAHISSARFYMDQLLKVLDGKFV